MKKTIFSVIVLVIALINIEARANDFPPPPKGFAWFVSANKVGTFLKPDGWFVKEEGGKVDKSLFITKEDLDKVKKFGTGLSVNMVPRVKARTGTLPTDYAKTFLAQYSENPFKILGSYSVPEQNGHEGFGLKYSGINNGVNTVVQVLIVASNRDDTLYILIFEAPENMWAEESLKGQAMLNMVGLGE